jgi:predicted DNA-binding protein
MPYTRVMRKTSVYLGDAQAERLRRLAAEEGRSQADILRAAVDAYEPDASQSRNFALAAGFPRRDDDPRAISQIPEHELLDGFGA